MDEDENLPAPVQRLIRRLKQVRNVSPSTETTTSSDVPESQSRALQRVPDLTKRRDYAHGEQFRNGQYWRGRKPKGANFAEILKLYKQNNQISRCLRTVVSGILGKDPEWDLRRRTGKDKSGDPKIVTSKTNKVLKALEASVGDWHDDADVQRVLEEAKFVEQWGGSCCLRLYIPDEFTEEVEVAQGTVDDLPTALELLFLQVVEPGEGGAIRDDHDRIIGYYYLFKEDDDAEADGGQDRIELHAPERTYILDGNYNVLTNEDGDERSGPNPLFDPARRRRPRFMMFEMKRKDGASVTSDVMDAQDALNVSGTYQRRNEDIAGFRSLVTINAKPPTDAEGKETTWKLSADVTLDLVGFDLQLESDYSTGLPSQQQARTTPGWGVIEPVDPAHFQKSESGYKADIYDHFDQMHLYSPFLAISGEAKREDRNPYEKRIITEAVTVADALTWVIETPLAVAGWLSGENVEGISCKPRLYLDVSQGSIDLWSALVSGYPDSVSLETLVQVNPAVTDIESEMERLKTQQAERKKQRDEEVENARRTLEDPTNTDTTDATRAARTAA